MTNYEPEGGHSLPVWLAPRTNYELELPDTNDIFDGQASDWLEQSRDLRI